MLQHLAPLLQQIQLVDETVETIATGRGRVSDLVHLQGLLKQPLDLLDTAGRNVVLVKPSEARGALQSFARELHLEVHAADGRYPVYLLCRISTDWDAPDTVLEELHVSPRGDFFTDERFTVLLRGGRSRTFLRLSPFRLKLTEHLKSGKGRAPGDAACDRVLESVATLVLAAAWYEDQRLPFAVADVLQLAHFRAALELVGFVLGSDLYQVATGLQDAGDVVPAFFDQVYESQPLAVLLRRLLRDGAAGLADLEAAAQDAFQQLNRDFSALMSTTGAVDGLEGLELYKIVLGHFGRLREVLERPRWTASLEPVLHATERRAEDCVQRIIG